jgi:hypothetical protein
LDLANVATKKSSMDLTLPSYWWIFDPPKWFLNLFEKVIFFCKTGRNQIFEMDCLPKRKQKQPQDIATVEQN